jgi:hypothetical protein
VHARGTTSYGYFEATAPGATSPSPGTRAPSSSRSGASAPTSPWSPELAT